MKYSIYTIAIVALLVCCKKDQQTKTVTVTDTKTVTVTVKCLNKVSKGYDKAGNLATVATYYYHGNQLDSLVEISYSTNTRTAIYYYWLSDHTATTKKPGSTPASYIETDYDANYNPIEYRYYSGSTMTGRSTATYDCK